MQIVTTADMTDLGKVFRAIRADHAAKRPKVRDLSRIGSLETYKELTLSQFRDQILRAQQRRLHAFCLGRAPTRRSHSTSKATCDADVVQ